MLIIIAWVHFKTPPAAPLRPSCVPLLLFLDIAFHTNSQESLLLLHRKKNIDTVKEPALMGTVCPQLTILFFVAIFSFFALHFVSAKANPMLTAIQPQNKKKENQAPNGYTQ